MKYSIFEGNLERLEQKLKRIENKCNRYGVSFHYEVVGEEFKEQIRIDNGEKVLVRYIIIDVEGFAKVNDWEFVATIDHGDNRNVVRCLIDIELPSWVWTVGPGCDHCKKLRHRKDTYLIHNVKTGEFKQVGNSCLRDFTGGYDADLAAAYISMYDTLIQGEAFDTSASFPHYYDLDNILKMSKAIITKLGFVSSNEIGSSKDTVFELLDLMKHGPNKSNEYLIDTGVVKCYEDFNDAECLQNLKSYYLDSEETSSYMQNLKSLMSSDYCKAKDFGYIVSAVFSYDREMEKIRRQEEAKAKQVAENELSQYLGNIKDKITVEVKEATCVSCNEDNYGGLSYLYKFIDINGNCLMWSTGKGLELERIASISGTVKDHKEFRGLKQTWITRCKVTEKSEEVVDSSDIDVMEETWNMWKEYENEIAAV